MKLLILKLLANINKLFFPTIESKKELIIPTFKAIFIQKILGINRKVRWPVHFTTRVVAQEKINPGTRAPGLSICCHLDGRNGIEIGENVWIGPRVSIVSTNHSLTNYKKYTLGDGPVIIGKNCWLAANVVILPNVELADHVVVAAGSIVTKSFLEPNILIGGVPAKKIKSIPEYES